MASTFPGRNWNVWKSRGASQRGHPGNRRPPDILRSFGKRKLCEGGKAKRTVARSVINFAIQSRDYQHKSCSIDIIHLKERVLPSAWKQLYVRLAQCLKLCPHNPGHYKRSIAFPFARVFPLSTSNCKLTLLSRVSGGSTASIPVSSERDGH